MSLNAVKPGDPVKAEAYNKLLKEVNRLTAKVNGGFSQDSLYLRSDHWWYGVVVAAGPAAEVDYTDNRYWIKRSGIVNAAAATDAVEFEEYTDYREAVVTATNLNEIELATHTVPIGSSVIVIKTFDNANPPFTRYYFTYGGAEAGMWIRITGSSSIGDNRWSYTAAEAELDQLGVWKTKTGGWSGTAYNSFESFNSATGVQGSGDNIANLPSGVTLQPIGPSVVRAAFVANCLEPPTLEVIFEAPNNPGGACE